MMVDHARTAATSLFFLALICSLSKNHRAASFTLPRGTFSPPLSSSRQPTRAISSTTLLWSSSTSSSSLPTPNQEQTYDDFLPSTHPLRSLLTATAEACAPRRLDTTEDAHEAFRYEWGTWCSTEKLDAVMETLGDVRLVTGAYEEIMEENLPTTLVGEEENDESSNGSRGGEGGKETGKRIRIAGGKYWDIILHVLPKGARYQYKWPEGSWTIVQPLTGLTEVAQLRGPNGDGYYTKMRPRDVRGGGDGSGFLGGSAGTNGEGDGYSTAGEVCVKYLGGPLRSYTGKAMKSTLLEVVVRPPIDVNIEAAGMVEDLEWESVERVFAKAVEKSAPEGGDDETEEKGVDAKGMEASYTPNANENTNTTVSSSATGLNRKMGLEFENVGGLDAQLDDIARRVLASRANPAAARRLGVSHVRGILLSGPPGCGKTLLARELSRLLGAREPQIVNGPEILDKFIGEAERRVRDLFLPAEREYEEVGDASALHIIILDEMDAIARKRGSMTSDSTGVRDSVVNQLLAKIDGVKEAPNILVVGLTNRPELLDPALLRPGRLEVQLRVELPDRNGRRDIMAIHTRRMREDNALHEDAIQLLDDLSDDGMGARTEHFSGAELAGLVRSAASFALARAVESGFGEGGDDASSGIVMAADLERALKEVRPALGTNSALFQTRYPFGISECSSSMKRIMRDLTRFTTPVVSSTPRLHSMLLVGAGGSVARGGSGVTALASHTAAESSINGRSDFVRFITALDILTAEGGGGDEARAAALVERFSEAREMSHSLLVLDDIDQIASGSGPGGYSSIMLSTLRALIRTPPPSADVAKAGGQSKSSTSGKTLHIIATTSRSDAACTVLNEIFEETIVVPLLVESESVEKLLDDCLSEQVLDATAMSEVMVGRMGKVGCKTALRLAERAVFTAGMQESTPAEEMKSAQLTALESILDDLAGDEAMAASECEVI